MKPRNLKIQPRSQKGIILPELRRSGRWLQQVGSTPGSRVGVIQENGRLVIELPA